MKISCGSLAIEFMLWVGPIVKFIRFYNVSTLSFHMVDFIMKVWYYLLVNQLYMLYVENLS